MGSLFNNVCYASNSEAVHAYYSTLPPSAQVNPDGSYFMRNFVYDSADALWHDRIYSYVNGVTTLISDRAGVGKAFPPCDVSLSQYPLNDVLFVVAVLILFALGYQSGMHR